MLRQWQELTKNIGVLYEHSLKIESVTKDGNALFAEASANGTHFSLVILATQGKYVVSITNWNFSCRTDNPADIESGMARHKYFGWVDCEAVGIINRVLMNEYWNPKKEEPGECTCAVNPEVAPCSYCENQSDSEYVIVYSDTGLEWNQEKGDWSEDGTKFPTRDEAKEQAIRLGLVFTQYNVVVTM